MKHRLLILWPLLVYAGSHASSIDFAHEIAPILRTHCAECHAATEAKGGFSINTRDAFLESDAATVGDSTDSYFLELLKSDDPDLQMPPQDHPRVSADQVAILEKWVDAGMPWTESFTFAPATYQPPLLPRQVTVSGDPDAHPIDRIIGEYAGERDLPPAPLVDDPTFVRRASLDLVGLLPPVAWVDEFTAQESQQKYDELIDALLSREVDYAEHWLTFWNDLLRNDYEGTGFITGGRKQISGWLYQSLVENKPFDLFTRELIAPESDESRGFIDGIKWRGTVSAGQTIEIQFAQSVAQSFLGINLKCASCHDSFIDRWKLSEAYSLAAVYSESPLEIHRCDKPTGVQATAGWLFPELGQIDPAAPREDRLKQLAGLVTDRDNGRFSRTIVNRLWSQLMGRGIVHPLDAMHTRPWNEDLLDFLANYLVQQNYDLKAVVRLIATSRAYRSRADFADHDQHDHGEYVYRGPKAKRMTAEQFVDAVWQLTGAAPTEFDAPIVRGNQMVRASLLRSDYLMRSLGRPNRDQIVSSRPSSLTTLEAIDLAGGETLAAALATGAEQLAQRKDLTGEQLVERLFRSALSRGPTAAESETLRASLGGRPSAQSIADALWAICMMPEFIMVR